jgi:hypothetical protein
VSEDAPDAWDTAAAWLGRHGALPALGVLTICVGLIYSHVFGGEVVGDDLTFHFAESRRIADCLRQGDWDFWNPSANGGYASAYYYQVLPQLASAFPTAVFGHHLFWFELSVWLPLVLAPAAAYRGARMMGATPWQAVFVAFVLAFTIGDSRWGFASDGTFSVGLYTQTWALAAFPLALGHGVRWLTEGKSLAPAIAWGAFVGLCHPFGGVSLGLALAVAVMAQPVLAGLDALLRALGNVLPHGDSVLGGLGHHWRTLPPRPLVHGDGPFRALTTRSWLGELVRLFLLGGCLLVATLPGWITMFVDYNGFGGFPHRVDDEVGPGFKVLFGWYLKGKILDTGRHTILTFSLPVIVLFARPRFGRWLWAPAVVFALFLGMGPHMPKTADDLVPAVRFLGAMQIVLALGLGAGVYTLGKVLWGISEQTRGFRLLRIALFATAAGAAAAIAIYFWFASDTWPLLRVLDRASFHLIPDPDTLRAIGSVLFGGILIVAAKPAWTALATQFGTRTAIAAALAAGLVLVAFEGGQFLYGRVRVLADFEATSHPSEMSELNAALAKQPPGRKQVGAGAENHWWNLLSYVYQRRPSLLQMGGGGLQASPNYDYLWSMRDFTKNAYIYDAPYLVFARSNASKMPVGDTLFQTEHYELRKLPAPGLVSPVRITGTLPAGKKAAHAGALEWIKTDMPVKDHVLAYDGGPTSSEDPTGKVLRAFQQDSPGDEADILAEVEASTPTTFMARESWHPRWRVYIDGTQVPLRRVTPDFPAVDVPAGKHVIAFRFERPWWANWSWLMWPAVALAAWLVMRARAGD